MLQRHSLLIQYGVSTVEEHLFPELFENSIDSTTSGGESIREQKLKTVFRFVPPLAYASFFNTEIYKHTIHEFIF